MVIALSAAWIAVFFTYLVSTTGPKPKQLIKQ